MATPTFGSQGTNVLSSHSTLGSVGHEAQRKTEKRTKRRTEESVSKSRSSSEEEEDKDPITLSSNEKEYMGSETPSQSNSVDDPEPPPFKINRLATRSTLGRPTFRPKRKVTRSKLEGPSSNIRKKHRG